MLTVVIPELEVYNENTNEFTLFKEKNLTLEHSLVSVSKWESKWKKPFLSKVTLLMPFSRARFAINSPTREAPSLLQPFF